MSLTFTVRHSADVINVVGILDGCVVVGGATVVGAATADCNGWAVRQG